MTCKFDCIQKALGVAFYKYGKFVSRHPLPFLIVPILLSLGLPLGLLNINRVDDVEYMHTPINAPSKEERTIIKSYFPENDSYYFSPSRRADRDGFFMVIITNKDGGNIYTETFLNKAITLDSQIKAIRTSNGNESYSDLCGKWKGQCSKNYLLTVLNGTGSTILDINLTYPLDNSLYFLGFQLGGVEVNSNNQVVSAEALYLSYFVRYLSSADITKSVEWLGAAKGFLTTYMTYSSDSITVNYQSSLSLHEEIEAAASGVVPRFIITCTILLTFSCLTCFMLHWVRAKLWFAIGGEITAGMAIISSYGILTAAGVPFITTVEAMPFIIIGIGIDDMFVILSAWRHTNVTLSVEERVGLTYKTAAISITMTSITDVLMFVIGSVTRFRSITLLCAYAGVGVVFSYIYAITFLAALLTYSGEREAANRHEMTCRKVLPSEKAGGRSKAYRIFCTGGYESSENDHFNEEKIVLPYMNIFIREKMAPFLMKVPVKIIVVALYSVYFGIAIWGCVSLQDGIEWQNLAPDDSYLVQFIDKENKYFVSNYGPKVMIAFTDIIDYSNTSESNEIIEQINIFRNSSLYYSDSIYLESWLSSYLSYLSAISQPVPTNMTSFIDLLHKQFLAHSPYDRFISDISFNADYTNITASRFLVQAVGIHNNADERKLMLDSRKLAIDAKYNITVYHPIFIYIDGHTGLLLSTIQNLGIALACMLVVSLLLLPSLISVCWVVLSVLSICIGVIGYMSLWDVNIDSISMIYLIMTIGFSIDFSAHISCHFSLSTGKTANERAIDALGQLGLPILQAAFSTILGIVLLSTTGTYLFRTFFKIMFLVMVFGFAHAMFVLPVVLSITGPENCCKDKNEVTDIKIIAENEIQNPTKIN